MYEEFIKINTIIIGLFGIYIDIIWMPNTVYFDKRFARKYYLKFQTFYIISVIIIFTLSVCFRFSAISLTSG